MKTRMKIKDVTVEKTDRFVIVTKTYQDGTRVVIGTERRQEIPKVEKH